MNKPRAELNSQADELLVYCYLYQKDIYVRAFRDEWCSLPISELPGNELLEFLMDWKNRDFMPHRIIREHKVELPHE